ncbi:hypothetical protein [Egibacter rhizosphaerae]|uniref:hypothetical protein n=1 Tax=Egibacter rhizosphaerae TaxID=1670831 RepID=UPI0013F16C72|nr:hypothetical protein [Egibacter rhizosphaerae]
MPTRPSVATSSPMPRRLALLAACGAAALLLVTAATYAVNASGVDLARALPADEVP